MKHLFSVALCFSLVAFSAVAEVTDSENDTLRIFGSACEDIKAGIQSATTRMKATDKACYNAVSSHPEIVNIKSSFDDHDYNVMIYNIVDQHIEDLTTKTIKQDDAQICIEVAGYITPENIGKAIDDTIKIQTTSDVDNAEDTSSDSIDSNVATAESTDIDDQQSKDIVASINDAFADESIEIAETSSLAENINDNKSQVVVLSTIFVKPTEFYNNTLSATHSKVLKSILSQNENIHIVTNESEANFIITPKVLKAKIEPINNETSKMHMVVAIDMMDCNQNNTSTEHQSKMIMFNNGDDEQVIAKDLLKQLFEQSSLSILKLTDKSNNQVLEKHDLSLTTQSINN